MADASPYILKKNFLVSSADVDFEQKLRFSSLTNYLIQIAWQHAEQLKWGSDDLIKHNLVWVLSGLEIELDNYPVWRDTITIETWPKGLNRLFYLRDFNIIDASGKRIGKATSNWILIDVDTRRPKILKTDSKVFEQNLNKHAIENLVQTVRFNGDIEHQTNYTTRFSDIDLNNHVTTTRYIDLMFDTYTPESISENRPVSLVVNFRKEVKFNRNVLMQRSVIKDKTSNFQLISDDPKEMFFLAQLGFR